ncbi:Divergent AAA domain [uncultured Eubacterium sp.]|nr:Divergent AAA domain [uncultured Eubacterium sp.]
MNIKELIGETTQYDKKTALEIKKPKSWCKSVSAFANTYGGKLIFGIADNNEIVGLQDPESDAEKISEIIKNPSYDSRISNYKVEDFAFSKLRERYKKWTGNSFDEKDLISFGLANEQGYLTNAGALIADESPVMCS